MQDNIRPGGLFRCTIAAIEARPTPGVEGDTLRCPYCKSWVRFVNGAWEWAKDLEGTDA